MGQSSTFRPGWSSTADVAVTSFTNFGPTDDGRIKPDLVANGYSLYSSVGTGNADYDYYSGTSMSTPTASGVANLILRQYEILTGTSPRASTLKGVLLHTTHEGGQAPGPDYRHGWGLLNAAGAASFVNDSASEVVEADLAQGETDVYRFYYDGQDDVRVTMVWTDPAGPWDDVSLNPTTLRLVNDLDVRLVSEDTGTVYLPWILDPTNPGAAATAGRNQRDNVERIDASGLAAGFYTVEVYHSGSLSRVQNYSLLQSGMDVPTVVGGVLADVAPVNPLPAPVSVLSMLDGSGAPLSNALAWDGVNGSPVAVDATIGVTLTDDAGSPIVGYPADDIYLQAASGGWEECPGTRLVADGPTDANGFHHDQRSPSRWRLQRIG